MLGFPFLDSLSSFLRSLCCSRVYETLQKSRASHHSRVPSPCPLDAVHASEPEATHAMSAPRFTLSPKTQDEEEENARRSFLYDPPLSRLGASSRMDSARCEHAVHLQDGSGPASNWSNQSVTRRTVWDLPEMEKLRRQLRPCRVCFREASTKARTHSWRKVLKMRNNAQPWPQSPASLCSRMSRTATSRRNWEGAFKTENYRSANSRAWIAEAGLVCRLTKGHVYAQDFDDLSGCAAPLRKAVKAYRTCKDFTGNRGPPYGAGKELRLTQRTNSEQEVTPSAGTELRVECISA